MRKQFLVIIALVAACLVSVSCGKEGETGAGDLVGTWVIVKEVETMSDGTTHTYTDANDWSINNTDNHPTGSYILSFSNDGVLTGKGALEIDLAPVAYYVKNGVIFVAGFESYRIVSNNGTTLVLEDTENNVKSLNSALAALGKMTYTSCVYTYKKQ